MTTVFLGSTSKDLEAYRKVAIEVCNRLGLQPIAMEYFNAQSAGATEGSKHELDKADLYVGFYAHRYGYIESGYSISVTEIEFDYAGERGLDRICFVVDPNFPWPPAHTDHENYSKLEAFKKKVNTLIRGQFTSVDNFSMLLEIALSQWMGVLKGKSSSSSALLATHPDDLTEKPDKLFGRHALLTEVRTLLEKHERVLLQGFGGIGKTALAATLAAHWLTDGKGNILWLKAGSAEADTLFEALARPFGAQQAIASQPDDTKPKALRDLLRGKATLLVLDDCWNGKALLSLLKAVPSEIELILTARQRYSLDKVKIRPVDELDPTDALALLAHHADRDLSNTPQAAALCDLLGNHAFAIEIAGKTLKANEWIPADLIQQIKDAPDKMSMPLELSERGRENVAKLLEVSLQSLDEETRNVFLAFGAFFAPQTTPEMLMRFFIGTPEVSDERLAEIRAQIPDLKDVTDDELRPQLAQYILNNTDTAPIAKALDTLHLHGLTERLPATEESVTAYRIHDLAYSYVRAQNNDDQRQRALQACLSYTEHYNEPSLSNFAALRPEMDNLLGAAYWASEQGQNAAVEQFAWNLYAIDGSQFLNYAGFYNEAIYLLVRAVEAARRVGNVRNQAAHIGNLGTVYKAMGHAEKSLAYYEETLTISRQIGDKSYEGNVLGNVGTAYSDLGQLDKAVEYYLQALTVSRQIGDKRNEGNQLGNLGTAYSDLGQLDKAVEYYLQALTVSRQIGDKRGEGIHLGNLGNAYHLLGQLDKAVEYHLQALTVNRQIGDKHGEGNVLGNIGNAYHLLGQMDKAVEYYLQALTISRQIGDKRSEASQLGNLGTVYSTLGQIDNGISYFEQALTISRQIGDKYNEGNQLGNLGMAYDTLGQLNEALQCYQQTRTIFADIGVEHLVAKADRNIALVQGKIKGRSPTDTPDSLR